jgi:hypothetical protein
MPVTARQSAELLFVVLVFPALLVVPSPPAGADSCTQYQGLVDAGYPQRALALIDAEATRLANATPPCGTERDNAEEAVAKAEAQMAELDEDTPPEAQRDVVDRALAIDRENVRALTKQVALAASTPPAPAECSTYAELIAAGYPQRALALIDAQTKRLPSGSTAPCGTQRVVAEQAVAAAELEMGQLAEDAEPTAQRDAVDAAFAADKENARAVALDKKLDADEAWTSRFSTNWKSFWDEQLAPGRTGVLALLGWLLGAAIALNLLTRLLRNEFMPSWGWFRRTGITVAWVGVTVGGLVALRGRWSDVFAGLAITLISLLVLVVYRRTRARLDITTTGDKAPSAEHVRAVLHRMGTERSGHLEMPTASDASILKDVVVLPDSTGVIGKAVTALVGMLTLYSPWRLNIEAKSDDTVNVELYRNYVRMDAAVLNRANFLLFLDDAIRTELAAKDAKEAEKITYDFAIVAAAMALTAMARAHGFAQVLGGATKWQSVGLEYLARQLSLRSELRGRILTEALEVNPSNDSARLALWHHRYRYENELSAMQTYWELTKGVTGKEMSPVLKLGARYAQVVAGVNLRASLKALLAETPAGERLGKCRELEANGLPTKAQVQTAALTLVTEMEAAKASAQSEDAKGLAEDMEWSARTLAWSVGHFYLAPKDKTPEGLEDHHRFTWGLTPHYNAACYWADKDVPDFDRAIRSLVLAGETTDSEWLSKDPQLRLLRKEQQFRTTFGTKPRTDLLLLMPFATYAEGLRKQGLTSARLLAEAPHVALRAAGVPFGLLTSIKEAGAFARSMPAELVNLQVEILDALDKAGYRFAVPADDRREEVKKAIVDACLRFDTLLDEDELSVFLGG